MKHALLVAGLAALALPAAAQQVPPINAAAPVSGPTAGSGPESRAAIPADFPPPLPTVSPSVRLSRRDAQAVGMATRWRQRRCGTGMGADGVLSVVHGACEPTLVCAPLKICVVMLEPGEMAVGTPLMGDPRWQAIPQMGVDGGKRTMNIGFKPSDAGLDSNFVLNTNQRTISLRLVSTRAQYMPYLKLGNPAYAQAQQWKIAQAQAWVGGASGAAGGGACDGTPVIPPSAFEITVPSAARAWGPTQVYTVAGPAGARTCIEFPADIASIGLPALVVLDSVGGQQLTTARQIGRRMEVDATISSADLVQGVGGDQVTVNIRRKVF